MFEIKTALVPTAKGAYSQGLLANGFLFTAGLGPQDPSSGQVVGTDIHAQTIQVLQNLSSLLAASGLTLRNVVKATVHLKRLEKDFAQFDAAYQSFFEPPYPVRTTVGSDLYGILVEIDVVASVPPQS